jgi:hypothetical protein
MIAGLLSTGIAIVGIIIGIVLREFGPDWLKVYRYKGSDLKRLLGEWEATWWVTNGTEKEYSKDRIKIIKIAGNKIIGEGKDVKGIYVLEGIYSKGNLINFSYKYKGNINLLVGGLVVKVNPIMDECKGQWHGLVKEDFIMGGRVHWKHI